MKQTHALYNKKIDDTDTKYIAVDCLGKVGEMNRIYELNK